MDNKTAIQQAIENTGEMELDRRYSSDWHLGYMKAKSEFIAILKSLLPVEKKILEDTWKAGNERFAHDNATYKDSFAALLNDRMIPDLNQYMNKFNY